LTQMAAVSIGDRSAPWKTDFDLTQKISNGE